MLNRDLAAPGKPLLTGKQESPAQSHEISPRQNLVSSRGSGSRVARFSADGTKMHERPRAVRRPTPDGAPSPFRLFLLAPSLYSHSLNLSPSDLSPSVRPSLNLPLSALSPLIFPYLNLPPSALPPLNFPSLNLPPSALPLPTAPPAATVTGVGPVAEGGGGRAPEGQRERNTKGGYQVGQRRGAPEGQGTGEGSRGSEVKLGDLVCLAVRCFQRANRPALGLHVQLRVLA